MAVIFFCAAQGAFIGYLVYVAVLVATGKGFTAVLVGSLWAAAVAARALLTHLAARRREE